MLAEHIGDKTLLTLDENSPTEEYTYTRDIDWFTSAGIMVAEVMQSSLGVGYERGKTEGVIPILCFSVMIKNACQ